MKTLYDPIEPYQQGRLKVSEIHELYYEQCGNPDGQPVVVLHGGPGGGSMPYLRRLHDPATYRIILFDQRGCGKSTPHASLTDGIVPARSTDFNAASNVYWFGQEAGPVDIIATELAPAAGELSGLVFGLELDGVQRLTGLLLSVDSNDDYAVDYSLDGTNWTRLVDIAATQGSSDYGMDTFTFANAAGSRTWLRIAASHTA